MRVGEASHPGPAAAEPHDDASALLAELAAEAVRHLEAAPAGYEVFEPFPEDSPHGPDTGVPDTQPPTPPATGRAGDGPQASGDDEDADSDQDGNSDCSSVWLDETEMPSQPEVPPEEAARDARVQTALRALDEVDLEETFARRAALMKSVPAFLRGSLRAAFRVALEEAQRGRTEDNPLRRARAWKLFLLVLRLLLYRPASGERVPKEQQVERAATFARGQ